MIAIALLIGYNTRHLSQSLDANDIVASSPMQGYYLGQLLIGSLGVLFVTGEYSTGMIRATMTAVPKRVPVLWAKLIVFVTITLSTLLVTCLVAFLSAEAVISHYRPGISLSSPGALRVVLGTAVYLTLVGTIGAAIGWIVRSTPGALVTYLATILVIPVIFGEAIGHWGKRVAEVLPSEAGSSFVQTIRDQPSLSPWLGLAVMVAWVIGFFVVAVICLRRRDA
jgi:ABC-2 type transport system permease protein